MIKNDKWIREMAEHHEMIWPFEYGQVQHDQNHTHVISYGTSSFGYDTRAAAEWKLVRLPNSWDWASVLDPKNAFEDNWENTVFEDTFVIPPHGFVLTRSVEYYKIPRNIACAVLGKSTYARLGLIVNATPLEPEWEGHITLELTNSTPLPIRVYGNEGIAQVLFFEGEQPDKSYADKQGKYQKQVGITMARV